jgi:hypothetical protein
MSATYAVTVHVRRALGATRAARRGTLGVLLIVLLSTAIAAVPGALAPPPVDAAAELCTFLPPGYTGELWRGKHWPAAAEACRATYHAGTWEVSVDIERFDRASDAWDLMGATPTGGAALQAAFHLGDTSVAQADPGAAPGINRWAIFLRGGANGCYVVSATFGDAVQQQARELLAQVDQKLASNAPCPRPPTASAQTSPSSGSESGAGTGAPLAGTLAAVIAGLLAGALGAGLAMAAGSTIGASAGAAGDVPSATPSGGANDSGSDSGQAAGDDGGMHAPLAYQPLGGSDGTPGDSRAEPPPDEPSDDSPVDVATPGRLVDRPGDLPQVEPGDPGGDWVGWVRAPNTEAVLNASGGSSPDDGMLVGVVKTTTGGDTPDTEPDDKPVDESDAEPGAPVDEPVDVTTTDTTPDDTTGSGDSTDEDGPGDEGQPEDDGKPTATRTPEEVQAENTAKRDKYRQLIAQATAADDPEVAARLQTLLRQHANIDAQGVPQGDLQALERVVNGMLTQPAGTAEEFARQAADFLGGVGSDVAQVGSDAVDAGKRLGSTIKDAGAATVPGLEALATDPALRQEFWNVTKENIGRGVDRAIDKGAELGGELVQTVGDLGRGIGDLLTDPTLRQEFVDVTKENIARGLEQVKSGATDTLRTATDSQFWTEALGGTISDLLDPEKFAQAFRDGVPGGKQILDAMDPSKGSATERLLNAFSGAAEWAGTADLLHSGMELGGAAIEKGLGALGREGAEIGADGAGPDLAAGGFSPKTNPQAQQLVDEIDTLRARREGIEHTRRGRELQAEIDQRLAALQPHIDQEAAAIGTPRSPTGDISTIDATNEGPLTPAQRSVESVNVPSQNPTPHLNEVPGLNEEHAKYDFGGNPNNPTLDTPNRPYTCNSGVVINDPFEAALARHAEAKPIDTPFKSFTPTFEKATRFNSQLVAQVDMPESKLLEMMREQEAGRVPYARMQNTQYMGEREFCFKNVPREQWKLITQKPAFGPQLLEEQNGPLAGFEYYRNANREKVYRFYRGVVAHDIR